LTVGFLFVYAQANHVSIGKAFLLMNAALVAGIACGSLFVSQSSLLYIIGGLSLGISIFLLFSRRRFWIVFIASFCLGCLLLHLAHSRAQSDYKQLASFAGKGIEAIVKTTEQERSATVLRIATNSGILSAFTFDRSISAGDKILTTCGSFAPFSLSRYAQQGIVAECKNVTIFVHGHERTMGMREQLLREMHRSLGNVLPSPGAELIEGIIIGQKQQLPDSVTESLQRTGTTHVVVLSGYNISVIAFCLLTIFRRFGIGLKSSVWFCFSAVFAIVALSGFQAPAVRAGIMVLLVLIARSVGRPHNAAGALLVSAGIMASLQPLIVGWSLSFQLSFLATLGVVMQDAFRPFVAWLPEQFGIRENAQTTLAATVMTLPVIAHAFGSMSYITLLANAVILPLVPIVFAFGLFACAVGFFPGSIALVVGFPAYLAANAILQVLAFLSRIPGSFTDQATFSVPLLVIWYAAVLALLFLKKKEPYQTMQRRGSSIGMYIFLSASCIGMIVVGLAQDRADLQIHVLDVGQGDAIHLRAKNNFDMLIDTGPDASILSGLGATMPYFDRTVELIVLTHAHADHISGMEYVLEKYSVKEVWISPQSYDTDTGKRVLAELAQRKITVRTVSQGSETRINGDQVVARVLWPPPEGDGDDPNHNSLVVETTSGNFMGMFMADADVEAEQKMLARGLVPESIDFLKVGHQGSQTSTSQEFLSRLRPTVAVISVGKENSYGHPHKTIIDRLHAANASVYRTDLCARVSTIVQAGVIGAIRSFCPP